MDVDLNEILSKEHAQMLADAVDKGVLALTFVVGHEQIELLNAGKSAVVRLNNGGVVLLFSQKAVEDLYSEKGA